MKKLVALLLALMMLLASCAALAEDAEYPEKVEGIDFNGQKVWIADYWTRSADRKDDPTEEEQAQYDYRDWINATYNVEAYQQADGDWGTNATQLINFNGTGTAEDLRLYIIEPGSVGTLMANGVIAAWNDQDLVDLNSDKWNTADLEFLTKGGKTYGVVAGNSEPRQCLYFNKRVLEEAGIDWNTIYDMQANGTWTWAAWEEMMQKIHRDTDNDGVIDIYGFTGSSDDMMLISVFVNGGSFFAFDDNGNLQPTMNSDEALSALAWAKGMKEKYFYYCPEGGNWDYYKEAFKAGNIGFYMYQCYGGFNDNAELGDMEDEWGAVAFPVPNEGDTYLTVISDNFTVIPSCYDAETVAKLVFLYDLWSNPTPGYDDEDSWIGNKYNYTDERAVDETYAMLREPDHAVANRATLLGTVNDVLGQDFLWSIDGATPAELVETNMPKWQSLCDTFNGVATAE